MERGAEDKTSELGREGELSDWRKTVILVSLAGECSSQQLFHHSVFPATSSRDRELHIAGISLPSS